MTLDLLVIAPHPDDAELYCGGLLAKSSDAGYRTAVADLTEGELSSRGDVPTRRKESEAASAVLKLQHRENLAFPDGSIGRNEDVQLTALVHLLRRLKPELLVLPYWEERHPDHVEASRLCTRAVFFSSLKRYAPGAPPHTPRTVLYYQMRVEFSPSFVVDISNVQQRKRDAILCYESQLFRAGTAGETQTLLASPLMLRAVESRDAHCGALIGSEYGEPYLLRNTLSLSDPVKHFRDNPVSEAHFFRSL